VNFSSHAGPCFGLANFFDKKIIASHDFLPDALQSLIDLLIELTEYEKI